MEAFVILMCNYAFTLPLQQSFQLIVENSISYFSEFFSKIRKTTLLVNNLKPSVYV